MAKELFQYCLPGFLALVALSALITWVMIRVQVLAVPNSRSSHATPTPSSGGAGIVAAAICGVALLGADLFGNFSRAGYLPILWSLAGGAFLAVGGLLDDLGKAKSFSAKFAFQLAGTLVLLGAGVVFEKIHVPFLGVIELGAAGYVITLFWVIGLTNAFNFMDGIDGLAGGTSIIVATALCVFAHSIGYTQLSVAAAVLLAGSIGFMIFNFPTARIFMGDIGSQFLGFSFAAAGILLANYGDAGLFWLIVPILFFHFIFDTVYTFCRRLKDGEPVTKAHRSHLYQLLIRSGYSHVAVSMLHFAMNATFACAAFAVLILPARWNAVSILPVILIEAAYLLFVIRKAKASGTI